MRSVLGPIVASVEANFSVGVAYCRGECIRIHGTGVARVPRTTPGSRVYVYVPRLQTGDGHRTRRPAPSRVLSYMHSITFAFSKGLAFRLTQDALHCTLLSNGKSREWRCRRHGLDSSRRLSGLYRLSQPSLALCFGSDPTATIVSGVVDVMDSIVPDGSPAFIGSHNQPGDEPL